MQILKLRHLILIPILVFLVLPSCNSDDEPIVEEENELITTVILELKESGSDSTVLLSFKDLDGDGGNDPVIVGGILNDSSSYSVRLSLLNESVNPPEDITEEIKEEAAEHQFFMQSIGLDMKTTYSDVDGNGKPVGLEFTLLTFSAGSGELQITLRHEPDKSAAGVAEGNIENAGGETDIEIRLPITVQ